MVEAIHELPLRNLVVLSYEFLRDFVDSSAKASE
jgi:hypothetical protein